MSDAFEMHQKWLEERFSHLTTMLDSIRRNLEELKDVHTRCITRCTADMGYLNQRLRDVERMQAERAGAHERDRESRDRKKITWQMIVAVATVISAVGVFAGYFLGRM